MRRIAIYWVTKSDPLLLNFDDAATAQLAFTQISALAGEARVWRSSEAMINCKHILHANLA